MVSLLRNYLMLLYKLHHMPRKHSSRQQKYTKLIHNPFHSTHLEHSYEEYRPNTILKTFRNITSIYSTKI